MTSEVAGNQIIFQDNFSTNGPIDASKWHFNVWTPPDGGGSHYGNTQQRQELPSASNGVMQLRLDTYNPTDPNHTSFVGSEAITQQLFNLSNGPIAFEAQVRYEQDQRGIIGGFFTFAGPPNTHDEIDFEAMSNSFDKMQTNIYHNQPLGEGDPISYPLSDSLANFHTYRVEWYPTQVRWLIDGAVVRTETNLVPDKAMAMHFNIWAPPASWPTGDSSLKPAASAGQDQTFIFDVKDVKVETLSSQLGSAAADNLVGTSANDYINGGDGNDTISGGVGDDVIEGGAGINTASYSDAAKNFAVSVAAGERVLTVSDRLGSEGTDTLSDIQNLHFNDRSLDSSTILKAASLDASKFVPLIDLYNGYLHRAPDAIGLDYWAARLSDGMNLADIAKSFYASVEALAGHPAGQSLSAMVSNAYGDILGRAPDTAGLNYWVAELQSGRVKAEDFALAFIKGAQSSTGSDAQTLSNKESIGAYFAIEQGLNNVDHATAVLAPSGTPGIGVTDVQAAKGLIDGFAAAAAASGSAELVVKLVGVHVGEFVSLG